MKPNDPPVTGTGANGAAKDSVISAPAAASNAARDVNVVNCAWPGDAAAASSHAATAGPESQRRMRPPPDVGGRGRAYVRGGGADAEGGCCGARRQAARGRNDGAGTCRGARFL